ncbi:MAG: hypothetical protein P4L46_22920 [Fimbriimonas sp.]|nr:hypothetical protein [Fimbriimonas sp.]
MVVLDQHVTVHSARKIQAMRPKFWDLTRDGADPVSHRWKPVYERVRTATDNTVVATVVGSGADLMLQLTENCPEPFAILYVLVVPRRTQPGRYQLKEWMDRESLVAYLERYRAYLEGDGRHNLWVKCGDDSLIVYDRHETLYLYGDLDGFIKVLEHVGYGPGEVRVDFPHEHHYNYEYDGDEQSIVNSGDYTRFDLVPGQDIERDDPRIPVTDL